MLEAKRLSTDLPRRRKPFFGFSEIGRAREPTLTEPLSWVAPRPYEADRIGGPIAAKMFIGLLPFGPSGSAARTNPNLSVEAERNGHMLRNLLDGVA